MRVQYSGDGKVHVRARPDAPAAEPALCGKVNQSSVTSAWGYWGPNGNGWVDICKDCARIEQENRRLG